MITINLFPRAPAEPTLTINLDCALIGGKEWQARALWGELKQLREWWYEQFNVAVYVGRVDWFVGQEITVPIRWTIEGYRHPTLLFVNQDRLEGDALGLAQGEFATVAFSDHRLDVHGNGLLRYGYVAIHELGHLLSLKHNDASFMHEHIEESSKLPVLSEEREQVREYIVRMGLNK